MIKQYLRKRTKIAFGFLNTYIRKKGQPYDDIKWWDVSFYSKGVSNRQTISQEKSVFTAQYHYASMELQILKYLRNNEINVKQSKVLDIGSGSGYWIDFYKMFEVGKITGMDVSQSSFKYLVQKYSGDNSIDIHYGQALDVIRNLNGNYDIANAIGVMFHIVDDNKWRDTIFSTSKLLKEGGLFIIGGHFGYLDRLNVQIDKNWSINKRLRSKSRWVRTLKEAGFRDFKIYRNNAYLWINDFLPENNVLVATK